MAKIAVYGFRLAISRDFYGQTQPPATTCPNPAVDALRALDPDALSPREALEALYRLKELTD